jgi:hypothetical protein
MRSIVAGGRECLFWFQEPSVHFRTYRFQAMGTPRMSSDDPARYREQAEYCRRQAQRAHDPRDKEAWLKIAGDWLQLASDADRRRSQREAEN